ncbi:MAG: SAM-dependent chlorinase/fluorinase, partial [Chloroflexi bacterium]|nr:SAM-dependent chlorinase/fluorinase [Chloroflexota bacterium]
PERRPLAARMGGHYFVGPDNGLLTPIIAQLEGDRPAPEYLHLNKSSYWLPKISGTFHGRDIFSPVAAHLASGVPFKDLGTPIHDPIRIEFSRPVKTPSGWQAHVTVIDQFGNLTTDLPAGAIRNRKAVRFRIHEAWINGVLDSYGYAAAGELVAVVDSEDYIELARVNGSAAQSLNAKSGDIVEVILTG